MFHWSCCHCPCLHISSLLPEHKNLQINEIKILLSSTPGSFSFIKLVRDDTHQDSLLKSSQSWSFSAKDVLHRCNCCYWLSESVENETEHSHFCFSDEYKLSSLLLMMNILCRLITNYEWQQKINHRHERLFRWFKYHGLLSRKLLKQLIQRQSLVKVNQL